jgi:hypothetical protein
MSWFDHGVIRPRASTRPQAASPDRLCTAVLRWTCDGNHLYYVPVEDD